MTENEAINELTKIQMQFEMSITEAECGDKYAKEALKDNRNAVISIKTAISALKEIQQYREIGTVEECREAMEKRKVKKPKDSLKINPVIDGKGTSYPLCPNCGTTVGLKENCDKFCCECGQAIAEDLEGMEDE